MKLKEQLFSASISVLDQQRSRGMNYESSITFVVFLTSYSISV